MYENDNATPNDTTSSVPYKYGTLWNLSDCHPSVTFGETGRVFLRLWRKRQKDAGQVYRANHKNGGKGAG